MSPLDRWALYRAERTQHPAVDRIGAQQRLTDAACGYAEMRALAARKMALIEQKMADLAAMHQVLRGLVERCYVGGPQHGLSNQRRVGVQSMTYFWHNA